MMLPQPLPGRECGACTACCVDMEVNDPDLVKPDRVPCPHMLAGTGCAIHERLPVTCRNWFCGWRFLNLSDAMRPDLCGVLLAPEMGTTEGYEGKGGLRIILTRDEREALFQDELIDFIAKCVSGGAPIFLSWGEGPLAMRLLVNDELKAVVADGDRAEFVRLLKVMQDQLVQRVAMAAITAQNQRR